LKLNEDVQRHHSSFASTPVAVEIDVASVSISEPVGNCTLQISRPNITYHDSLPVASNDSNAAAVNIALSTSVADCDDRIDSSPQAVVSNLPGTTFDNIDDITKAGDNSFAQTTELGAHFHHENSADKSLAGSADIEPVDSRWQNSVGNGILSYYNDSHRSPRQQHENTGRSPTISERYTSPQDSTDAVSPVYDTLKAHSSEAAAAVNRKRRVSAARSALYRRLLSSETAGSSDADFSGDIFDLQSLSSSDDDDDDDVSDLGVDSDINHPSLVFINLVELIFISGTGFLIKELYNDKSGLATWRHLTVLGLH